jgi:Reverse transcriptase (RNA-dependent DNA polymerase)
MQPVAAESLTQEQRQRTLAYLMFLKQKRCGKVKGRGCADGRKQRVYTAKEEASSPTVSIEPIMLSCVIDAKEGQHVAMADIPGAFMQADMDEVMHMRLEGTMRDLLLNVAPEFSPYVTMENGRRVLYVLLTKALYGTLRAALLFWRKLTSQLKEWGFKTNAYDPCVVNHMINGAQCTILWHVDDLKISHVDKAVVEKMLSLLGEVFGKEAPLTIHHGDVHDYLSMRIDYSTKGKVKITMFDYVKSVLSEAPEGMEGTAATPAANHLFKVNEDALPVDKLSMGKGATYSTSNRQKLNTRSSTEAETVGLHDVLPKIIWTRNFLDEQGYGVKNSILHQDNKSTILLAGNG